MEKLLKDPSYGEIDALMEDLELESVWRVEENDPLTQERVLDFLSDRGFRVFPCMEDDRFLALKEDEAYLLNLGGLPVVLVRREFEVGWKSIHPDDVRAAAEEITTAFTPAKVSYDDDTQTLGIAVVARHEDMGSFMANFDYYLSEIRLAAEAWESEVWRRLEPLFMQPTPARSRLSS